MNEMDAIAINVNNRNGYYILLPPKDSERLYMLSFVLSKETDGFDKSLGKMTTAVSMAAGMQDEVFDLSIPGMNRLGFIGISLTKIDDSGEYNNEDCTARREVIDNKRVNVI